MAIIKVLKTGSIFESGADYLVNPVNCFGSMGKGLAREFRAMFPKMFEDYKERCSKKLITVGKVSFWNNRDPGSSTRVIVNFPTKDHWSQKSELQWIENGLQDLSTKLQFLDCSCIAFPALGCGLGGLKFRDVLNLMEVSLESLPIQALIFKPQK